MIVFINHLNNRRRYNKIFIFVFVVVFEKNLKAYD